MRLIITLFFLISQRDLCVFIFILYLNFTFSAFNLGYLPFPLIVVAAGFGHLVLKLRLQLDVLSC